MEGAVMIVDGVSSTFSHTPTQRDCSRACGFTEGINGGGWFPASFTVPCKKRGAQDSSVCAAAQGFHKLAPLHGVTPGALA
jgi:hypothetical protein